MNVWGLTDEVHNLDNRHEVHTQFIPNIPIVSAFIIVGKTWKEDMEKPSPCRRAWLTEFRRKGRKGWRKEGRDERQNKNVYKQRHI